MASELYPSGDYPADFPARRPVSSVDDYLASLAEGIYLSDGSAKDASAGGVDFTSSAVASYVPGGLLEKYIESFNEHADRRPAVAIDALRESGYDLGNRFVRRTKTEALPEVEGDPLIALQELLTPTPEQKQAIAQSLDTAERHAAMFYLGDAPKQQQVRAYANGLRWLYMAEPGQALPDCFVQKRHYGLTAESMIEFHATVVAVEMIDPAVKQALRDFGRSLAGKLPMVRAAARQHIMTSPGYALLQGLAQRTPEAVDRPLTPVEYNWRVSQIGQEICQRYGINVSQLADQVHIAPRKEYARAVQRLDDETVRNIQQQPEEEKAAAIVRLRSFFMTKIAEAYKTCYGKDFADLEGDIHTSAFLGSHPSLYKGEKDLGLVVGTVVKEINGSQDIIRNRYLAARICRLFDTDTSAGEWLADKDLTRAYKDVANLVEVSSWSSSLGTTRLAAIRQSPLPAVESEILSPHPLPRQERHPDYKDQALVECLKETVVAEVAVDNRTERDLASGLSRLIMAAPREAVLPEHSSGDTVLTLRFSDSYYHAIFNDGIPYIPGFTTVAEREIGKDYYEFDFKRDPAGDPYNDADAAIPVHGLSRLVEHCESQGFTAIAQALRERSMLTITNGEFADIVGQGSDYYVPSSREAPPPQGVKVRDGRPQVQCKHAAALYRDMLREAHGSECARVISGVLVLGRGKKIAAYGHDQTIYAHNGVVRIYDATPSEGRGTASDSMNEHDLQVSEPSRDNARSEEGELPMMSQDTKVTTPDERASEFDEQTADRRSFEVDPQTAARRRAEAAQRGLAVSRQNFTLMMSARLGLHGADERQIWDYIARTHGREGDVIGEVAHHIVLAAPAEGGSLASPDALEPIALRERVATIEKTLDYIQKVGEVSDLERKQLGLAGYNNQAVEPFRQALKSLAGYYRQLADAKQQLADLK